MKRGYIVYGNSTTRLHDSKEKAMGDAERAAKFNPGRTYIVFESIGHVRSDGVIWTPHAPEPAASEPETVPESRP